MADPHIYLTQDNILYLRATEHDSYTEGTTWNNNTIPKIVIEEPIAPANGLNFSQSIRTLIEIGLNSSEENILLKQNSVLLEKIFSRQLYLRDLIEQFYSDMEIEKLSNPRNNKALQKFKTNKDKLKYDE